MKKRRIISIMLVSTMTLSACGIKKMPNPQQDVTIYTPIPALIQATSEPETDTVTETQPESPAGVDVQPEATATPEPTPEPDRSAFFDENDPYVFKEGKAKKKVKKDVVNIVSGAKRMLPGTEFISGGAKVSISYKGLLKKAKAPKSNRKLINKYSNHAYNGVYVKAVRSGKAYVTVKTGDGERYYTVRIHSKKTIRKKARKALNKKFSKLNLSPDSMVFFTDMDGDGISELYAEGKIYAYQYETGAVNTIDPGFEQGAISAVYVSKKYGIVYIVLSPDTDLKVYDGAAKMAGRLVVFDKSKIATPQQPISLYEDSVSFCLHDPNYILNHLDYDHFNIDDWKQFMKKLKLKQIGGEIKG